MIFRSNSLLQAFVLLACLPGSMVFVTPAFAAEILVTTTNNEIDTGFCVDMDYTGGTGVSLQEAICIANNNGAGSNTIWFLVDEFTLTDRLPFITSTIIFNGNGAETTQILGNADPGVATQRIVEVLSTGNLTLSDLTIAHGRCAGACITVEGFVNGNSGGGILNHGTLNVSNSRFHGNSSTFSNGGAIYNAAGATLTVFNSTFSSNSTGDFGSGGGIYNGGTLTVGNSTLQDNTALNGNGGGIFNLGTATLLNSTLSENRSLNGSGGVYNAGTLNFSNTIIANAATGGDCVDIDVIGTNINNLVEDASCSPALSGDPNLGPLADNGGSTPTMALLLSPVASLAINAGDNNHCLGTDQRGVNRPQGANCDIGAYEAMIPQIDVSPSQLDQVMAPNTTAVPQLQIENTGGLDLNWSIEESNTLNSAGALQGPTSCSSPADISWLSVSHNSDTTPSGGGISHVDVIFDSTGLASDTYTGVLCVNSNDPDMPLVEVPVSLSVTTPPQLACNSETFDFESGIPPAFTRTATGNTDVKWVTTADDSFCGGPNWSGNNETPGSGEAACVDADLNNNAAIAYDAQMMTNSFDLSTYSAASLDFAAAYQDGLGLDKFDVDVSTNAGGTWINELSWDESHHTPGENVNINLAAYLGQADVIVRFRYYGDSWDWWAEVDDISLNCSLSDGILSDGFEDPP